MVDEEASGDESSLRQGAGTRTSADPDLGIVTAAEERGFREKGLRPEGFRSTRNK